MNLSVTASKTEQRCSALRSSPCIASSPSNACTSRTSASQATSLATSSRARVRSSAIRSSAKSSPSLLTASTATSSDSAARCSATCVARRSTICSSSSSTQRHSSSRIASAEALRGELDADARWPSCHESSSPVPIPPVCWRQRKDARRPCSSKRRASSPALRSRARPPAENVVSSCRSTPLPSVCTAYCRAQASWPSFATGCSPPMSKRW
mmetsp:Transcript_94493/g.267262  ORF Transcript_94493/g.267262 Transcript_94493/m.267262 type:complete len:211 (-) Transcript_94493:191-823(-)